MRDADSHNSGSLKTDEQAIRFLESHGATSVADLFEALSIENSSLSKSELVDLVQRFLEQGKIDLEEISPYTGSFSKYLILWEKNLWLYGSLMMSLLTILVIYVIPSDAPYEVLRWVSGCAFVLFVPGYVAIKALFPYRREMDSVERLTLSIGLSLALVPLVGLVLNFSPWGISLLPLVVALNILVFGLAGVAFARQYYFDKRSIKRP